MIIIGSLTSPPFPLTSVPQTEAVEKLAEELDEHVETYDICDISRTCGSCGILKYKGLEGGPCTNEKKRKRTVQTTQETLGK